MLPQLEGRVHKLSSGHREQQGWRQAGQGSIRQHCHRDNVGGLGRGVRNGPGPSAMVLML